MKPDFTAKKCLAIIRRTAIGTLALWACSCETVVPYPDTGAKEMLYINGAAEGRLSTISVRKIFPITDKNFVAQKRLTMVDAKMLLTVNGEEIITKCSNDSLECVFTSDYEFLPGDRVTVKVSAIGLPDASCEATVPEYAEVLGMSCSKDGDNTLNFNASIQTDPDKMEGYAYLLEAEASTNEYVDGSLTLEKTDTLRYSLHYGNQIKGVSYRGTPVTGYEDADEKGVHYLSTSIQISGSYETPDGDGHTVRKEYIVKRVRLEALHLSESLYIGLKTQRDMTSAWSYSDAMFVSPLEYSNITGGKGCFGCVSTYKSEWIEP